MKKGFRKYLHAQWVIFLASQGDDSEFIEYLLFIVYRNCIRDIP